MKVITLDDIIQHLKNAGIDASSEGAAQSRISKFCALKDIDAGCISFYRATNPSGLMSIKNNSGTILAKNDIREAVKHLNFTFVWVTNPDLAACLAAQLFVEAFEPFVHPNALIDSNSRIGKNCHIGANVVIREDVLIGNSVIIEENCVLSNCTIGDNNHIYPWCNYWKFWSRISSRFKG